MKLKRIFPLVLAAVLSLGLTACQPDGGEPDASGDEQKAPAGVAVQVQEVALDTISTENKVSGQVVSNGQESVFVSAQAECTAVYVEVGDSVTEGQAICRLNVDSTLSSYNAASISYSAAAQSYQDQAAIFDSQIALAEKNLEDLKALFELGASSQMEIDQAELSLQSVKAQRSSTLSQLQAGMQSYLSNMEQLAAALENVDSHGNVTATVSGTVIALNAVEGSYVSPSAPVAVIDQVDQLEVSVFVSEALVTKLAEGDEVDITVSALNRGLTGAIKKLNTTANAQTKLYSVTISVLGNADGLMSGMFADVAFRTDTSAGAVVIPTETILTNGSQQYVFVVEDNTARYVEISTGLAGSGVTEVTSGLKGGELLVTVGQSYLSDGDTVRIVSGEG